MSKNKKKKRKQYNANKAMYQGVFSLPEVKSRDIDKIAREVFGSLYYTQTK